MPNPPGLNMIRTRIAILVFSILNLLLAILNSAIARFATVLRDRARMGLSESDDAIFARAFERLMGKVLGDVLIAVFASAFSAVFGLILVGYPRWLRENSNLQMYYGAMQLILSLFILVTGAYLADHVHGFQSSFAWLQRDDNIPYYSIMYYGGIGEAAHGALLILIGAGSAVFLLALGR